MEIEYIENATNWLQFLEFECYETSCSKSLMNDFTEKSIFRSQTIRKRNYISAASYI